MMTAPGGQRNPSGRKEQTYREALINRMGTPVQRGEVMAGNMRTSYLSAGSGFPLVCLHGAGAGAVTWYPALAALAGELQVIAPDIVGYGESDKPDARYDRPFFSAWLRDFLAALDIPRAHFLGLSQGGAIALQFALDHPQKVEQLVLASPGGLGARPSFSSFFGMLWMNTFPSRAASRYYSRHILFRPENRDPLHEQYSLEVLRKKGGNKAFRQGRGAAVAAFPASSLRRIGHDTLIIWGEDDQLFPVDGGEAATRILPRARLTRIKNAGHLVLMDQPSEFNNAVLNFLC